MHEPFIISIQKAVYDYVVSFHFRNTFSLQAQQNVIVIRTLTFIIFSIPTTASCNPTRQRTTSIELLYEHFHFSSSTIEMAI